MNSVVINLQTYGIDPGCAILSIGAVQFDIKTGQTGAQFYKGINLDKSVMAGFRLEEKTIDWWRSQGTDAYMLAHAGRNSPTDVLMEFNNWLKKTFGEEPFYAYSNSARFGLGILHSAYQICGVEYPINSFYERDFRTLYSINDWTRKARMETPFEGMRHHPLNDCLHHIKVISKIMNKLSQAA